MNYYSEEEVKDLLREQRGLCKKHIWEVKKWNDCHMIEDENMLDMVLNAPSPSLPIPSKEIEPIGWINIPSPQTIEMQVYIHGNSGSRDDAKAGAKGFRAGAEYIINYLKQKQK